MWSGHDDGDEDVDADGDGDDNEDHVDDNETNLFCLSAAPFPRVLIRRSLVDMTENILGVILLYISKILVLIYLNLHPCMIQ